MQSAKTNQNVEQVFFTVARDIKQRLTETVAAAAEVAILPLHMLYPHLIGCHVISHIDLTFTELCSPQPFRSAGRIPTSPTLPRGGHPAVTPDQRGSETAQRLDA
jgi:hypothetical protein